ncbi:MAG: 50S ribosomal protein L29 [Holosporaceae bacterium]|jgi:ribosomal protein L29|nr:50S ribosomal protein L29 [Holosporaceae bacterium]
MAKKKNVGESLTAELDAAKRECMRIRFRKILGESVSAHIIKNARKNVAKCVRSLANGEVKNV